MKIAACNFCSLNYIQRFYIQKEVLSNEIEFMFLQSLLNVSRVTFFSAEIKGILYQIDLWDVRKKEK